MLAPFRVLSRLGHASELAHQDIEIVREMPGVILDPSMPNLNPRLTSKMIIDAMRYDAKAFPTVCLPAAEAMEKVERDWERYGGY